MRCASCLTYNPDSNRFCGHCGTPLAQDARAADAASAPKWGELKIATVFFADIVGSTSRIAGLDPEQAMEQLQPAVQRMCDTVEMFGGSVIRTMGDGVFALFGVPHALEDHARLACEAALALQRAFHGNQQGLQVRVGLHSGQVASDPQAFDSAIGGGVHGQAIHLASRVVALAEPGGICLSTECAALAGDACVTRSIGPRALKGIAEPVEILVLERMRDNAPDHHFHRAQPSPLCGRDRELAQLQQALHDAGQGRAAAIGLRGAAGTGKSRLCYEFVQWCQRQLVASVTEVRTQFYGEATPLQPVLALMRGWLFHIGPNDDAAVARSRIQARLMRLGASSADDLAIFTELLGVHDPQAARCALEPKARRARLLELFGDMARHNGATTSVVVLENLQWLDEASSEFLDVLVRSIAGTRTVLLFSYRPPLDSPWHDLSHFRQIELRELSPAHTEALVRALPGPHKDWPEVIALLVERSAGNPFFAEELVHSLGSSLPSRPPDAQGVEAVAQQLPATLQALIGERIDHLGTTQKALLNICAVIGKEIPLPVLQQVALYLAGQLEHELDRLCEAELLQLLREIAGCRHFGFRQPLIQEVAYASQLRVRRVSLHAAVAEAMEGFYAGQPDEFAALIAFHYEAANLPAQAARLLARSAQWLGPVHSTQAMKHWRHARELLRHEPRAPDTDRLRVQIGGGLLQLGWREGIETDEMNQLVDETVAHAGEADRGRVQLLLVAQGRVQHGNGGSADDYVAVVRRAIALMPEGADPGRSATLHLVLSQACLWAGLLRESLAANDVAAETVAQIDAADRAQLGLDPERWRLGLRARAFIHMGRSDEARVSLGQMLDRSVLGDDPVLDLVACAAHVELAALLRDAAMARHYAASSAQLVQSHPSPYARVLGFMVAGMAAMVTQEFELAVRHFDEGLAAIRSAKVAAELEMPFLTCKAESEWMLGQPAQALATAKQAAHLAQRRGNRYAQCRSLIVWGAVRAREGSDGARLAQQLFARAEQLIAETGAASSEDALRRGRELLAPST
ncbi:MAG: Adenylate cyclase [Burkholderiaceae bacterium]|jgi:adenylate cyclase|nr:MAG: Adenylate cyclase [Burkholderiaceae bacterium]